MKKHKLFFILLAITILLSAAIACNVAKDNIEEQTDSFAIVEDKTTHRATIEEFKKMSSQEQWKLLSPLRRDELRRHYKKDGRLTEELKKVIAKDLDFEVSEESPSPPYMSPELVAKHNEDYRKAVAAKKRPIEEVWAEFSDAKKAYIRQYSDKYPQFAQFINDGE